MHSRLGSDVGLRTVSLRAGAAQHAGPLGAFFRGPILEIVIVFLTNLM